MDKVAIYWMDVCRGRKSATFFTQLSCSYWFLRLASFSRAYWRNTVL